MSRAVLFDVDGVLVHGYHTNAERRRRWDEHMLEDLGIAQEDFYANMVKQILPGEVLPGKRSLVNALEEVLPRLGYNGSPMNIVSYWLRRDTQLNLPLLEIIRRLRASSGLRLYIATNQEDTRAFYLWDVLGLQHLFDDIFHAARLGATKPDPAFFEAIASRIGPQDSPPLFFDDAPAVATAATAFGWEGVHAETIEDIRNHPWIVARIGEAGA